MALDVRKNAATMPVDEFENFLKACVLLKSQLVPGQAFSVYDQWVAIHGCIMGVKSPGSPSFMNMGHQNIAFLPWHREYVRRFELALQSVVPEVTIPYWPWPMAPEPSVLFSNARIHRIFFSSSVQEDVGGLFASAGPAPPPVWWPAGFQWRIQPALQVGGAPVLRRGSPADTWPPTSAAVTAVEDLDISLPGVNTYWAFWDRLEAGPRMHNTGHNIVGGYMANPVFSPNDPLFWLHHSFIDRIWSRWQAKRLAGQPGSTLTSHYPPPTEVSPFNGQLPPVGHRRDDLLWPWVGETPGYSVNAPSGVQVMLPNFSTVPGRRIRDVLDIANLGAGLGGYEYA
jgi:tyrosinase